MQRLWIVCAGLLIILVGVRGSLRAQSQNLPMFDYAAAKELPSAIEVPDPNITEKVVFDISKPAPQIGQNRARPIAIDHSGQLTTARVRSRRESGSR